jgi:GNAT superfamily N-acetyltransferase
MAERLSKQIEPWQASFEGFADLREVFALAKKHSGTLGFLPNSAFTDRGRRNGLLLARVDGQVVGYCLFDVHRAGHIKLVHVCVDDSARGYGIGKELIDLAVALNPHANGVLADCRRDYQMDEFWRSVGMTPRSERAGRARKGSILVRWWRPLGPLDLLEAAALSSGQPLVCIDSNIVGDLYGLPETSRPDREATLGLVADWLDAEVSFAVSPHVDDEINRIADARERAAQRAGIDGLVRLRTTRPSERSLEDELLDLIGEAWLRKDKSLHDDVLHLADAIRAGADFFVTNDANLLTVALPWLKDRYGIEPVRPHQLVLRIESKLGRPVFQSALIESVDLSWVAASDVPEADLEASFVEPPQGAKEFRRQLRALLADPRHVSARVLIDDHEALWAIYAARVESGCLHVPLLRVIRGVRSTTVALQLARYIRRLAVSHGANEIVVSDLALAASVIDALKLDGFDDPESQPRASVIATAASEPTILERYPSLHLDDAAGIEAVESKYWPLAVLTDKIPAYLIPIQPRWAERLFGFPNDALFHIRRTELGLSREHVYFNAGNPLRPGPARLLWYVTSDKSNTLRQLAARSRLLESRLLSPKEAHRQFGHLGVLSLREITKAARGDGKVNVIRFADTELLEPPVMREEFSELLRKHEIRGPIQSTREIPSAMYNEVVQLRGGERA